MALVIFSIMLLGGFFGDVPVWLYLLFILIWIIITAIGSFQIRWNYHLKSLNHNYKISGNNISITFDDGPNPEFTPEVLKILKEYEQHATFFLIGEKAEINQELVKQIINEGHSIGSHSYSHAKTFGFFSSEKIVGELQKSNKVLKEITGKEVMLFRPPFGVTNPNIKKAIKSTNHLSIGWSKRSYDTTNSSEEKVFQNITKNLVKGDVILLHDSSAKTLRVLERLLLFMKTQNLTSIPVDKLLEVQPYA